jgi:hypothetical protein
LLDGPLAVALQRLVAQQPIALDVPRQFDQVYRQEPFNSALFCNLTEDGTAYPSFPSATSFKQHPLLNLAIAAQFRSRKATIC